MSNEPIVKCDVNSINERIIQQKKMIAEFEDELNKIYRREITIIMVGIGSILALCVAMFFFR